MSCLATGPKGSSTSLESPGISPTSKPSVPLTSTGWSPEEVASTSPSAVRMNRRVSISVCSATCCRISWMLTVESASPTMELLPTRTEMAPKALSGAHDGPISGKNTFLYRAWLVPEPAITVPGSHTASLTPESLDDQLPGRFCILQRFSPPPSQSLQSLKNNVPLNSKGSARLSSPMMRFILASSAGASSVASSFRSDSLPAQPVPVVS
mmetsp:Transcript_68661/g.182416  ORF Transcript_68661/g.182416 Transcript_68661/m.182416 type:complete len:210 (+) Transcript_68661:1050-1679(+)